MGGNQLTLSVTPICCPKIHQDSANLQPMETCASCRHWKVVSEAPGCREGVCRNLSHSSWHGGWQMTDAADNCENWSEIVFYQGHDGGYHVERRLAARIEVDYPAILQTPGGTRTVRLTDMSQTGARLDMRDPPKAGIVALIQLGSQEVFCRIAWAGADCCGLAFDKPIARELVAAITGANEVQPTSSVNTARIRLGRKRAGLRAA